ncbi:class I mannose-6-phosphate isomerase [Erythrobacter sp.]|jgi:mannose-6-phosphate isomerase|uniref:class I mannose-6-phosphate isomerase n=1 Tax=Erythrobacter sp. TaxID=1042 RepID=UPI002EAC4FA5|nr:class I mannose-6-phosphate isomerase [Erythrobacter sp.]
MSGAFSSRRLPTRMVEKVWGRDTLPAPFAAPGGQRIGEIWFEPPPEMPRLLVKYLFTSDKLSVQVHPGEDDVLAGEQSKEECWLVLDAEPGAQLGIGFNRELSAEAIGEAARDGSIEALMTWHDVATGDIFVLPPGTVHAIGAGLSLLEVQQNSDTTFRLYDYGRPRELHLERALAVARGTPYPAHLRANVAQRGSALVETAHFRLDRVEGMPSDDMHAAYPEACLVLPLEGRVIARDANADVRAGPGECLLAPSLDAVDFGEAGVTLLTRSA